MDNEEENSFYLPQGLECSVPDLASAIKIDLQ